MFDNFKKTMDKSSNVETIIGVSTSLVGEINSSASVKIEGNSTGNVISKGDIVIGNVAIIKGDLSGANIRIDGRVEGNVSCGGLLHVSATGKISGNIETVNLSVEDGGVINGNCCMTLDDIKRIIQQDISIE